MSTDYDIRFAIDPVSASAINTEELREHFLIEELFTLGGVNWTYTHYDRMAVGGAMPAGKALDLDGIEPTGTVNFLDRREMIAVNIGGAGTITGTVVGAVLLSVISNILNLTSIISVYLNAAVQGFVIIAVAFFQRGRR